MDRVRHLKLDAPRAARDPAGGALLTGQSVTVWLVVGGAIILAGVYVGAFFQRPRRWSASSLPECLPVDGCPEVAPGRASGAAR